MDSIKCFFSECFILEYYLRKSRINCTNGSVKQAKMRWKRIRCLFKKQVSSVDGPSIRLSSSHAAHISNFWKSHDQLTKHQYAFGMKLKFCNFTDPLLIKSCNFTDPHEKKGKIDSWIQEILAVMECSAVQSVGTEKK